MGLFAIALLLGSPAPSHQAMVYFNARMALREGAPTEALKLWLLRNAIAQRGGEVSGHDDDLRSVTWAALGELGLCPDGFERDTAGAGLWPLATHNWVVRNMRRQVPVEGPSPFMAFELGRQQRFVSLRDVLDATELKAARFERTACLTRRRLLFAEGAAWGGDLGDKQTAGRILRTLLREALSTLAPERVLGRAVVEARIFDLNLRLAGLAAVARRRSGRARARAGRRAGLSRAEAESGPVVADTEEGRILKASLGWTPEAWMALSSDRRQFLFRHAVVAEPAAPRALTLAIIDHLVEGRAGAELQSFIAHLSARDVSARALVWGGARGRRLLSLDGDTGFRERAVVALHRGVHALSVGQQAEAIRALAHALRWAETSRAADTVRNLSRRWLSFVASQFRVTDELFVMLRTVLPRAEYTAVLEDQLWHAALGADAVSFERCVRHRRGRGALNHRIELLQPLASGRGAAFSASVAERFATSPHFTLRFLRRFVERLLGEDATVRAALLPVLRRLKAQLEARLTDETGRTGRRRRGVQALVTQLRAIIEGLTGFADARDIDRAHGLSPSREVFAGRLRVAPSDPLPWPFSVAQIQAPSVFAPLSLQPLEWRDARGRLVFGWRISD